MSLKLGDNSVDGLVDSPLEIHRVGTCGNILEADVDDALRKNGGRCCAVSGLLVGLGSDLLYELGAHILEFILELDFLGYGDTVLGNLRSAVLLVNHDIAALRTESRLHCIGKRICAGLHL